MHPKFLISPMKVCISLVFSIFTFVNIVYSQSWLQVNPSQVVETGLKEITPQVFTLYSMDDEAMQAKLWAAPHEKNTDVNQSEVVIAVGLPGGHTENFKIVQYDMMESELASKYAYIRTFYGISTINSLKRIRIDYTLHGFRAVIKAPGENKIFIDHYQRGDKNTRIIYFKDDYKKTYNWGCNFVEEAGMHGDHQSGSRIGDCQLRSYRLAQATTGEYSSYHGASNSSQSGLVMTAVVNVINRINEVYEAEVAVRLILINNTDQVFYYNSVTDGYANNGSSSDLSANQTNCTSVIGSSNYDIGHVFGTGDGGIAGLGVVCNNNSKAQGYTGRPMPVGDPFTIDYVAHEMGHQFNANHTQYNSCNRNNSTAMEPGSASSIMGYAGICSPDVQSNSDDYFHAKSLDEIKTFLTGSGNACSTIVSQPTNNPPTITSVPNYSIPVSTPFVLTLNATDPQGHSIIYTWDQMNAYSNPAQTMPPASTNTSGPVFRSIESTTSPSRYFPPLDNIVNNTSNTWQVLPSVARSMSFRGVARDFTGVFGCNSEVNITVSTVNASSGAFTVTSFNSATTWNAGETKTITWNVANTTASPVSAANVDILLSLDGGYTYPIVLATATPNDGSQAITVPANATTQGRVMVKGSNHIFFDINNANITITASSPTFTLSATPSTFSGCPGTVFVSNINVTAAGGFNQAVTLSVSGLPSGANTTFTTNPVNPGNTSIMTITGMNISGSNVLTLNGTGGSVNANTTINVDVLPTIGTVSLVSPADMATNVSLTPSMSWSALSGSSSYNLEVAYDQAFTEILTTYTGTGTSYQITTPVFGGTTLYWRVRANNSCGAGSWTSRSYTVEPCYFYNPDVLPIDIPSGGGTVFSNMNITDKGSITDINVLNLVGSYLELVTLDFSLIHPQGTSSLFWDSPCHKDLNFNIQFDDAVTGTWPCPPTTGLFYHPSNPLSVFNNLTLNGIWKLKLERTTQSTGIINTWGLKACVNNYCRLTVGHNRKSGPGSLKAAIDCAAAGDTIRFASNITNDTIFLGDQSLLINKNLYIESDIAKNIHITSNSTTPTIINTAPNVVEGLKIKGIHIHSSNAGIGAINNNGTLTLEDVILHKWPGSSTATVNNQTGANTTLKGNCKIITD